MFYFIALFNLVMSILFYKDGYYTFSVACVANAFIALAFTRRIK